MSESHLNIKPCLKVFFSFLVVNGFFTTRVPAYKNTNWHSKRAITRRQWTNLSWRRHWSIYLHTHTNTRSDIWNFGRVKQLASLAFIAQQTHESPAPLHSTATIIWITNLCGNKIIAVLTSKFIIINDNHLSSLSMRELIVKL